MHAHVCACVCENDKSKGCRQMRSYIYIIPLSMSAYCVLFPTPCVQSQLWFMDTGLHTKRKRSYSKTARLSKVPFLRSP